MVAASSRARPSSTPVRKHVIVDSDDEQTPPVVVHRRVQLSDEDETTPSESRTKHQPQSTIIELSSSSDDVKAPDTPQPNARMTHRDPTSSVNRRLSARRILDSDDEDSDDVPIRHSSTGRLAVRRLTLSDDDQDSDQKPPVRTARRLRNSPRSETSESLSPSPDSSDSSSGSDAPMSDFIVDDDDGDDVIEESDGSAPEVSHHALLFKQQDSGGRSGRRCGPSLSVEDSYGVFYQTLVGICSGQKTSTISSTVRTASEKVLSQLHARMRNFVLSGAWSRDFISDINTAPCLSESPSWGFSECEVCRRPDRKASARIHFKGPRYHSNSATIYDIHSRSKLSLLLDEDEDRGPTTYEVGRFCRSRVVLYHRMVHYLLHTVVAIRTKWGRLRHHDPDPDAARSILLRLESDFYAGYEELLSWADRYAVLDQGRTSFEIDFSARYESIRANDTEVIRWVPELFSRSVQFP